MIKKLPSEEVVSQFLNITKIGQIYGTMLLNDKVFNYKIFILISIGVPQMVNTYFRIYHDFNKPGHLCMHFCIQSTILNVLIRLANRFLTNDERLMRRIKEKIQEIFAREEKNQKHRQKIEDRLKFSASVIKKCIIMWCLMCLCLNIDAWFVSWYTGEFVLGYPCPLPYTNPNILSGYIINSFVVFFYTTYLLIILVPISLICIFSTLQTIPMTDIYCMKIKDFGEKLVKSKMKQQKPKAGEPLTNTPDKTKQEFEVKKDIEQQLINLIKDFSEYNEYLNIIFEHMEIPSFVVLSVNAMAIGFGVLAAIYYSKILGGVFVFMLFFQVFEPCAQGAVIAYQKEKLLYALWDFPWYELSNPKQKIFLQILHLFQNSKEFSIPIVGDLNMEQFTRIVNAAYSSVLFLQKLLR